MTELIACTMIMLMVTGVITQTLSLALTQSQEQLWAARARNLCNLLTDTVRAELLYASDIEITSDSGNKVITYKPEGATDTYQLVNNDGKIAVKYPEEEGANPLPNADSYKNAKAEFTAVKKDAFANVENMQTIHVTITVSPQSGGGKSVTNQFDIRPVGGNGAFAPTPTPTEPETP